MHSPVIEITNLSVQFEEQLVLDRVHLQVQEGECLVLLGPSGQGKTTLLKTMAGLITPQSGELRIKNQNWHEANSAQRLNLLKSMGMLFQKNALFDSLNSFENIAFPLRETTQLTESEIASKVEQFLEAVGLAHARNLFPSEMSGGMQKRLGIARALALHPTLIFYDDPTAGLDPITSKKIIELILKMKAENKATVIAVTNDIRRAYQMADRIAYVGDREVIVTGSPSETKEHKDPRVHQFVRGSLLGPLTAPTN